MTTPQNTSENYPPGMDVPVTNGPFENHTWKHDIIIRYPLCSDIIPTSEEMFKKLPAVSIIIICVACILTAITMGIFIDEVIFAIRFFRKNYRIRKVTLLLSLYPVISFCSLTSLLVPKSSTITDLVSAVYLAHCLYQFVNLLLDYYGGIDIMLIALSDYKFQLRSPPCCCCCFCLPSVPTSRRNFNRIRVLVLQAAILRPIIMFIAAVLWTNGSYTPGQTEVSKPLDPEAAFTYIQVLNTISSLLAMYGCLQLQAVCKPTIGSFHIRAKLFLLQGVVISSGVLSLVCSLLVKFGAVPCSAAFSTDARSERLYNMLLIVLMCVLAVIARKYYRIREEGSRVYKLYDGRVHKHEDKPLTDIPQTDKPNRGTVSVYM